jgi:hypothetical protein
MPTIRVYIAVKKNVDLIEIPDNNWNAWSEEQQHQILHQMAESFVDENADYGAYVVEVPSE